MVKESVEHNVEAIQKEIVDESEIGQKEYSRKKKKISEDYFFYDVDEIMKKFPWEILKNENKYTNINEPLLEEILPENKARLINYSISRSFSLLDGNPFIKGGNEHSIMENNQSFSFKGYSLADIIFKTYHWD